MIREIGFNYWPPNEPVSRNKLVACTPFPAQNIEKKVNRGIVMADHKVSIQELTVVFAAENFGKEQKIYVRGDRVMQPWAKEVFTFEGKEFIFVPEAEIVFAKWEHNGPVYLNNPNILFTGTGQPPEQPGFTTISVGGGPEQSTTVPKPSHTVPSTDSGGPPRGTK